jgi:hypothetical protein
VTRLVCLHLCFITSSVPSIILIGKISRGESLWKWWSSPQSLGDPWWVRGIWLVLGD